MTFTMTRSASETFSLTHAKYLASKVTSDMWRCQQLYGKPTTESINAYGTELALLMRDGYVSEYEFGYKAAERRVVSWHYTVNGNSISASDDRPGRLVAGVNITGATFFNFLTYSGAWSALTDAQRGPILSGLPITRSTGTAPTDGAGFWEQDLVYSSSGVSLGRRTFRPYAT